MIMGAKATTVAYANKKSKNAKASTAVYVG